MKKKIVVLIWLLCLINLTHGNTCLRDSKQTNDDDIHSWDSGDGLPGIINSSWIPQLSRSIDEFEMVARIPTTYVYRFRDSYDISVMFYPIPEDVEVAIFTFVARELKLNSAGGDCPVQDLEVVLKHGSYPTVDPTNSSFPASFLGEESRGSSTKLQLKSDSVSRALMLDSPEPGDWFGVAYGVWRDPKSDAITQQGLTSDCVTILYSDAIVKRMKTSVVDCSATVELDLNDDSRRDILKCFIDEDTSDHLLNVSISASCPSCSWAIVRLQAGKIPTEEDSIIECAIKLTTQQRSYQFRFAPRVKSWHYIKIEYGNEVVDTAFNMRVCEDPKTPEAIEMKIFDAAVLKLVRTIRNGYFSIGYQAYSGNADTSLLKLDSESIKTMQFDVFPIADVGGTITLKADIVKNVTDENLYKIVICVALGMKMEPLVNETCVFNQNMIPASLIVSSKGDNSSGGLLHVPYPESGSWFITLGLFCNEDLQRIEDVSCSASLEYSVSSSSCIQGSCGRFGDCNTYAFNGYLISCCICKVGYMGFDCSSATNAIEPMETLTAILFLTLSNLLFIPSIIFAVRRKYYTEAVVYAFTMFFSTFYHACDAGDKVYYGLCIVRMGVLQYCDFFCGLLSFWVTLVAMADLKKPWVSCLHIFGVVIIAFGTELDKLSVLVFVIPIVIAVTIVLVSWAWRSWKMKQLFPAKMYWIVFLPVGLILVGAGLLCFTVFQTNSNYYIVHSVWHVTIALSVVCLLPTKLYFFPKYDSKNISLETEEDAVSWESEIQR